MNTAIVAVAGAGKTRWLANAAAEEPDASRAIVLTYTRANQLEDSARIVSKAPSISNTPKVIGWCAFLLNEIIKPYLPMLYPGIRLQGISPGEPQSFMCLTLIKDALLQEDGCIPAFWGSWLLT